MISVPQRFKLRITTPEINNQVISRDENGDSNRMRIITEVISYYFDLLLTFKISLFKKNGNPKFSLCFSAGMSNMRIPICLMSS